MANIQSTTVKVARRFGPVPSGFTTAGYQTGDRGQGLAEFQSFLAGFRDTAEARLIDACLRHPLVCPSCLGTRCRRTGARGVRCEECRAPFDVFDGRWIARRRIAPSAWLAAIKSFELGLGGRQTGRLSGLSMPTVYQTLETTRRAIASLDPAWEPLVRSLDEKTRPDWDVFGVRKTPEGIKVECAPASARQKSPRVLHQNGFVYTEASAGYDALIWRGNGISRGGRARGDEFLRFLMAHMVKHYGIPEDSFPLYLKEYEFRFNRRREPLFEALLDAVTRYVPE